jgi:hypothetical protein
MNDIEQRALERIMIRRGELPAPTEPPVIDVVPRGAADRGTGALGGQPGGVDGGQVQPRVSGRTPQAVTARQQGAAPLEQSVTAGLGAVANAVGEAVNPAFIMDDLQGALQNVSPVLMSRAIEAGAVRPLASVADLVQDEQGRNLLPDGTPLVGSEHVVWRDQVYPRRFTDPTSGSTLDPSTQDVTDVAEPGLYQSAVRLGRLFSAIMPDPLGGVSNVAATARGMTSGGRAMRTGAGGIERGGEKFVTLGAAGARFGRVDADLAGAAGIREGEILLPEGWHNPVTGAGKGLAHIEAQRGDLLQRLHKADGTAYGSWAEVVRDVVAAPYEVLQQPARRTLLYVGSIPETPKSRGRPTKPTVIIATEWNDAAQGYEIVTIVPYTERRLAQLTQSGDVKKVWPPSRTTANADAGDPPPLTPAAQSEASTPQGTRATGQTSSTLAPRAPENNDGR